MHLIKFNAMSSAKVMHYLCICVCVCVCACMPCACGQACACVGVHVCVGVFVCVLEITETWCSPDNIS